MRCDDVAALLPRVLDGTTYADRRVVQHVESCLSCQAELARYRRLLRLLGQLRDQRSSVPPGAIAAVLTAIERRAQKGAVRSALTGRRVAVIVGVAVSLTAAAATTVVLSLTVARPRRAAQRSDSATTAASATP
ncbi:MAG: hypothetical protein ACYDD4_14070 [Acidimicrobiales bacterium]